MSGRIERPRGTHDVVPANMPLWQRVTGEVERLCALYGYRKILTPGFEDTALLAHPPPMFRCPSQTRCRHPQTARTGL